MSAETAVALTAPEAREVERARLLDHLERLRQAGGEVPCQTVPVADSGYWTADDPGEQAIAAGLCLGCHARAECEAYGLAWPQEAGVYGARTERDRRPIGRPKKTAPTPEEAPHV